MKKVVLFSLVITMLGIYSCKEEEPIDPPLPTNECDDARTYTSDIKTILDANCATSGCHDAATAANDIVLADYSNAQTASSLEGFLKAIRRESGVTPMPIGAQKLSDALITELECWVEQGSPE